MLRVATVNVNGIRAAFRRGMGAWLDGRGLDVVALQEVRAPEDELRERLEPTGWHVVHAPGEVAGRGGVAVAGRVEAVGYRAGLGVVDDAGRWVEADVPLADGRVLTVVSAYVHTGQADDPREDVKLAFLDAALARLAELTADGRPAVLTGDLNVAHTHLDIKNWRGNRGKAGFLPAEQQRLDVLRGRGWADVARTQAGEVPGPYTWWSWRGRAYDNDAGWRIDYQWASPAAHLVPGSCVVDRAPSYAERWSDHAPLVVDYDLEGATAAAGR